MIALAVLLIVFLTIAVLSVGTLIVGAIADLLDDVPPSAGNLLLWVIGGSMLGSLGVGVALAATVLATAAAR
ncbi:hypothetical protein [Pseudolysinimonas sp.]|uniref:hypothetical protein n=1 Tax=Pseudolysinimonas sp. TaxID=2680009 RepID=UPI003F7FD533